MAPAALATVPYIEATFGAWHVRGGLRQLALAVHDRALERGTTVRTGSDVAEIVVEAGKVAGVFHSVASKYDVMNDLMSGGMHRLWKMFTIAQAAVRPGYKVLDIAGGTGDLAKALTDVQKEMFEVGKKSAANEMSVLAPATKAEVKGVMRVQNDALIEQLSASIENAAKSAVTQIASKNAGRVTNTSATDAVDAASAAIEKALEGVATMKTLALSGAVNLGRATIFDRYPEKVYAIQYSAILDEKTCDTCLSLDGRVMEPSVALSDYNPPVHWECRCILVEILHDEEFKPDIEDVPGSIPKVRDLGQYQDMQKPVVKENSPAIRQLKAEIQDRQQKLESYKASGSYPNRQATHEARIQDLQDALDGSFHELCLALLHA